MNEHPVFHDGILDGVHLLEADAGTGKTWTIAGLVVRALVEREIDIDRVLVVTFTNAATAELAGRIRERIAQLERLLDDRLEGRDGERSAGIDEPFCVAYAARLDDENARRARSTLRIALARVDEMAVHTIHGYCQRVIDEHALSIGVARGLPITPGADERVARRVADWWRAEVLDASADRLMLIGLAGLTPDALQRAVQSIDALPLARVDPPPGDWRALAPRLAAACHALGEAVRADGVALQEWLAVKGNANGSRFPPRSAPGWVGVLRTFCEDGFAQAVPESVERFATARFGDRKPPGSIPSCCDALLALLGDLKCVPGWIAQEIAAALQAGRSTDLAEMTSLGFDDLLRLVHDALADPVSGPALAGALREQHPVALIDECQDTDALQWEIVRRVYVDAPACADEPRRGALVLVGDPKQAIYAFRGADLHSYLHARGAASGVHRLDENQRSSPALIEAVNTLFERENPFLVEEIGFSAARFGSRPRRRFEAGDAGMRAPMTAVLLEPDPAHGALHVPDATRQAVQASVAEIARLLAGGVQYDERTLRPADIAVLVHSHRQGARIKRALAAAGIGAAEISRDSVFDTLESHELLRVIEAIAEHADPARLRSAFTTTLFGADATSLAALDADASRALSFAAGFAQARETWERLGPIAALRPLLREHGVGARLAALRDGDRRLTNLMHLIALLADDDASFRGPRQALHAWPRLRAHGTSSGADTGELRLESDEELVRIVTLHKSKGLEFPVVFLPFAWAGRAAKKKTPCVRHEHDTAAGWSAVLDFAPSDESADEAAREQYAENLRTLYVALTRAEHRCYLFWGAANNAQYAPLAWLLHGHDPQATGEKKPGKKTADAKKSTAIETDAFANGLAAWCTRANGRYDAAMMVVDTPTLMAGGHAAAATGMPAAAGAGAHSGASAHWSAGAHSDAGVHPGTGAHGGLPPLAARPWRTTIPAPSITTSFSAIASMLASSEAAIAWRAADFVDRPDHDQQPPLASPPGAGEADPSAPSATRFRFPAGAQAGVCLHGILEEAPFDAPLSSDSVLRWLVRSGYARIDAAAVAQWLSQVIATPLRARRGETIALAQVPAERQLREMDFHLSADGVSDRAVIDALATEFAIEPAAIGSRWSGFLRGFIDLVFEQGGRYYLVDWKSNHLGDAASQYGPAALETAMRAHAYPLQAGLYTLALHRWLRRTVPGYDYERHFGGAFYVFLRGAGLDGCGDGQPGVHASRVSVALVRKLDRLFAARPGEGRSR